MHEPMAGRRIEIVEADEGLRTELARALERLGFEVQAAARATPPEQADDRPRSLLRVIDLAADGAGDWVAHPAAAQRCLFLAGEVGATRWQGVAPGREHDVLFKPFSIQTLERRVLRRLEALQPRELLCRDPLLQTRSPRLARLLERAFEVSRRDCPISLEGELGTGRRALGRALHAAGRRGGEALVLLDAVALGEGTREPIEQRVRARVAGARSGTLIVVEPETLSDRAQQALQAALRAVAEPEAPRCITISRVPLDESARLGRLSPELLYRLSGATFRLPPLRERPEDHVAICTAIARRVARELGLGAPTLDPAWIEGLAREGFPGNRPGLESRLRAALMRAEDSGPIEVRHSEPSPAIREPRAPGFDLRTLERETIVRALDHANGNRTHASAALGISVRTLRNKIREYGLR